MQHLQPTKVVGIAVAITFSAAIHVGDTEIKFRETLFTVVEILKIALNAIFYQKYGLTKGCTLSGDPIPATLKVSC